MTYEISTGADPFLVCESVSAAGDKLLPGALPQAEYMYGCGATATGMILGYYDLYGYTVDNETYDLSNLIEGTISVNSRDTGGSIYDMKNSSVLCQFIASDGYVSRFYGKTPAEELPYTFVNSDPDQGLNVSAWDCLADYLGTGQYWRQNGDLSTTTYTGSLHTIASTSQEYTIGDLSAPIRFSDQKYGLSLLVQSRGYSLDANATCTRDKGDFTFQDYKAEIDAGRPVLISIRTAGNAGHMVVGYGYNTSNSTIIFDDTYRSDCRMTWNGTYEYSGDDYSIASFTTIVFAVSATEEKPVLLYSSGTLRDSKKNVSGATLGSGLTWDSMCISSGGSANMTTVNSGGNMHISSGGSANNTTVNSYGRMYVSSRGTAGSTTVNHYGSLTLSGGGSASMTTVNSAGRMYVSGGGAANSTTVNPYGSLTLFGGGSAAFTAVNSYGRMYVSSGGAANSTTVNSSGSLVVSGGGSANHTDVNSGGRMYVSSGGSANSTTVNHGGSLTVTGDGITTNIVENGGYVDVAEGADVTFAPNTFSGLVLSSGQSATVHSGTTANDVTVNSGCLHVFHEGTANSTTVNSYGRMYVSSGGTANGTTLDTSGYICVYDDGTANSATANSGGRIYVSSAGTAGSTTVNSSGYIYVYNGGTANNTDIESGGRMYVSSGGKITGTLTLASGAVISAYAGSIIDFDISGLTASAPARVNDLSLIKGSPDFTITVSSDQAIGTYKLAGGAANFQKSITICTAAAVCGTVAMGSPVTLGDLTYSLTLTDSLLSLTVSPGGLDDIPPEKPTAAADVTTPTNGDVTVTATFSEDSALKQFSLDGENWQAYTGGIVFSENGTVYFRGIDEAENISEVTSFEVTNIDKIPPEKPAAAADVTSATNGDVTVTATFSEDSALKQFSLDGENWQEYADGIVFSENGTVYFRGIDEAGNISEVTSFEVSNIYHVEPEGTKVNLLENGVSQVLAWDAAQGKVGFMGTNGNPAPGWRGVWEWSTAYNPALSASEADLWKVVAAGHFSGSTVDHDGILLYNGIGHTFAAWTNLNDPSYGYVSLCHVDGNFQTKCLGDFDANGFDDVVIFNELGSVGIVSDAASYHDVWHVENAADNPWQLLGAGTFDPSIGQDSILFRNTSNGHLYLWDNQGSDPASWNWRQTDIGYLADGWEFAAIGDFAGDGIDDIVLVNHNDSDAVFVWDDGVQASAHYVGVLGSGFEIETVGDYNADGKDDLLLREYTTGWGGIGCWSGADANSWTDFNARIETDMESKFTIVA